MKRRDKKSPIGSTLSPATPFPDESADASAGDASALFRKAMQGVSPLTASDKALLRVQHPPPIPRQTPAHEQPQPVTRFPIILRWRWARAMSGHFCAQACRARLYGDCGAATGKSRRSSICTGTLVRKHDRRLVVFLDASSKRGFRCVRVIHGKGLSSRDHEPVLKARVGGWLAQREDVLAFCQARPEEGGSGAVLVLLSATAK